jgi:hypothetical protein
MSAYLESCRNAEAYTAANTGRCWRRNSNSHKTILSLRPSFSSRSPWPWQGPQAASRNANDTECYDAQSGSRRQQIAQCQQSTAYTQIVLDVVHVRVARLDEPFGVDAPLDLQTATNKLSISDDQKVIVETA